MQHVLCHLCTSRPIHNWLLLKNILLNKKPAPGEARTHGLQIMRLTRCLLRYRGLQIVSLKTMFSEGCRNIFDKNHVTHGGTRTPNLRFRRPTPYPLGHAGNLYSKSFIHLGLEIAACWRQKVLTDIVQRIFSILSLSARLAQSVEHETLNLRVVGSSPTLGATFWKIFWQDGFVDMTCSGHTCYTGAVA